MNIKPILKTLCFALLKIGASFLWGMVVTWITASPVAADTAAELLEQGIYTEETVGDLKAAIEIYTRVIENAEANRPYVAQARFRLGMCHMKQGNDAGARAALDELIREFPDQDQLVAQAREQLAAVQPALALEPVPWQDGEILEYRISLPTGRAIGALFLKAESTVEDGAEVWRLEQRKLVFIAAGNQGISRVVVDGATQRPLSSSFRHGVLGNAEATYSPEGAKIVGAHGSVRVESDKQLFDNEQSMHLLRMLPLEAGYETTISFLPIWVAEVADVDLTVGNQKVCKVPAGEFECYKLTLDVGKTRQTFWVSAGPERYPVKLQAEGAVIELITIRQALPGSSSEYGLEEFDFSGVLPEGWQAYVQRVSGRGNKAAIRLLDSEAETISSLEVDRCPRGRCPSLQKTAEHELSGAQERFDGYELREGSWSERTIDGRPAISFVGNYRRDGKPWAQYRLYTFADDVRFEYIFRVPVDRFQELQPVFDSVAESLEAE